MHHPKIIIFFLLLLSFTLPSQAQDFSFNLFSNSKVAPLLPAKQAFAFSAHTKDAQHITVQWDIASGYYLYREKINLQILNENGTQLLEYTIPHGKPKHDEAFGDVELLYNTLSFDLPLTRSNQQAHSISLQAKFQGCAERGVCYPPMTQTLSLPLPAQLTTKLAQNPADLSEQDFIIQSLQQDSFLLTLLSFLGFGLLLAFTPCVFPMIPILSGIIIGQGKDITQRKAFLLSFSFVFSSALTYTVFGILAALFGSNLQADFQAPWVIYLFSALFVLLAFSMFDFYHIELPKVLQARLHNASDKHRDGSYLGAGLMGIFSSLIVGPCVAAPLAAALIYIGQTGDVFLGGSALFIMGMGMGVPLLIIGASAGTLLPKAGHWLNASKAVFGVIMLAVAIWMLGRVISAEIHLFLWAILSIISAIYLQALEPLAPACTGWKKLWKGLGIILLSYGLLMLVGLSAGNTNPLQPLKGLNSLTSQSGQESAALKLNFQAIHSLTDLQAALQAASKNKQTVMLDFYADWCISCKEMEAYTFTSPKVQQKLASLLLLRVDITDNTPEHKALLKAFNLIGPPAILFFQQHKELQSKRVIGFQTAEDFLHSIPKN